VDAQEAEGDKRTSAADVEDMRSPRGVAKTMRTPRGFVEAMRMPGAAVKDRWLPSTSVENTRSPRRGNGGYADSQGAAKTMQTPRGPEKQGEARRICGGLTDVPCGRGGHAAGQRGGGGHVDSPRGRRDHTDTQGGKREKGNAQYGHGGQEDARGTRWLPEEGTEAAGNKRTPRRGQRSKTRT